MKPLESSTLYRTFNFNPFLPSRFTLEKPNKIVLADLDDTLIPWVKFRKNVNKDFLSGNQHAFKEAYGKALIGAVTGLDFMSVRKIRYLPNGFPVLDGFPPPDFISTDNGMRFYSNIEGKYSSFGELVAKTKPEDFDKDVEAFIKENTGWDRDLFFKFLSGELRKEGFNKLLPNKKRPDLAYPHCKVYKKADKFNSFAVFSKGESAVYMLMNPKIDFDLRENAAISFGEKITKRYKREFGKGIKFNVSNHGHYLYIFFSPVGKIQINKASVFDIIANKLSRDTLKEIKAGIALGDGPNDTHLKVEEIELPLEEPVSVFAWAIGSGNSLKKDKEVSSHPRVFWTEQGNIGRTFMNVVEMVDSNA